MSLVLYRAPHNESQTVTMLTTYSHNQRPYRQHITLVETGLTFMFQDLPRNTIVCGLMLEGQEGVRSLIRSAPKPVVIANNLIYKVN